MGAHHLVSVRDDQLRQPVVDKDEFLRTLGAAVVLACSGEAEKTISIVPNEPGARCAEAGPRITVQHVAEHDHEAIRLWAWEDGDAVCVADLDDTDLDLLARLVYSIETTRSREGEPDKPT